MDREIVQNLAKLLASCRALSGDQPTGKFTELAYLCHFIQCYQPAMRIADWQRHPVYIMDDAGTRTGIAFCDLQLPPHLSSQQGTEFPCQVNDAATLKISELWLVFVAKGLDPKNPRFCDLVTKSDLQTIFDKIFLFDFFQSAIQIIN